MQAFEEDQLIFREQALVGAQHTANRACAHVCSHCCAFVGSIEAQLSLCLAEQLPGLSGAGTASDLQHTVHRACSLDASVRPQCLTVPVSGKAWALLC